MSGIDSYRDELLAEVDVCLNLVRIINEIYSLSGLPINLNTQQRDIILEWAFVNLLGAWEKFLEDCFVDYMLGVQTSSGYCPTRYVFPTDRHHALKLILAGRDFFKWTTPKRVREQATLCFENGEPFRTVLESAASDLSEMNIVRNAIVHRSAEAVEKFEVVVRNKLRTAPLGVRPGEFLSTVRPRTIRTTFLSSYCGKLKRVARLLVS